MLARVSNEITHPSVPFVLPAVPGWPIHPTMVTVTHEIAGFRIARNLGIVRGSIVRATSPFTDVHALTNGTDDYFQHLSVLREKARFQAQLLMLEAAARIGANAVIGVRYESAEIAPSLVELLVYGTAVRAEPTESAAVIQAWPAEPSPSSEIETHRGDAITTR
jgi:uncharacterized protein YbjQ (UPF0145 family)